MSMEVQDLAFYVCHCNWLGGHLLLRAGHEQWLPTEEISICVKRTHLSVEALYRHTYDKWPMCKQYGS